MKTLSSKTVTLEQLPFCLDRNITSSFISSSKMQTNRRSARLQAMGYYAPDGLPVTCYKETPLGKRKKKKISDTHVVDDVGPLSGPEENTDVIPASKPRWRRRKRPVELSLLSHCMLHFVVLCMGILHYCTHYSINMVQLKLQQQQTSFNEEMGQYMPDADSIPNFALKSLGASVVSCSPSQTHDSRESILGLHFPWLPKTQSWVIQGCKKLLQGNCWAFPGNQGHMVISLAQAATITHVTLGHISKSQSMDGTITNAPREFSVHGMTTADEEGTYLGRFIYDEAGPPLQTFRLTGINKGVYRYVKLRIESNWGHPEYTCIYNFRVHGKGDQ